jgi:hypothetical protein
LDVVSHRATRGAEETIVSISSEVGITSESSAAMVIAFRVEVFFDVNDIRFLVVVVIVSTLMLKSVAKSKETNEKESC